MKRNKTTPYYVDQNVVNKLLDWFKGRDDWAIIDKELFKYRGTTSWIFVWKKVAERVKNIIKENPDKYFAGKIGSWWFKKYKSAIWRTTIQTDELIPPHYLISKVEGEITPFKFIEEHMTRYMLDSGIQTGYTKQSMTGILERSGIHFLHQFFSDRFYNVLEVLESDIERSKLLEREKYYITEEVLKDRINELEEQYTGTHFQFFIKDLRGFDFVLNTNKIVGRKKKFLEEVSLLGYNCYEIVEN